MSRSNYDKPFYVDVGTSIVAVRCASNHDVILEYDHSRHPSVIELAKTVCDRMNKEAEIHNGGDMAKLPKTVDTRFDICQNIEQVLEIGRDYQNKDGYRGAHYDTVKLLCDAIEYQQEQLKTKTEVGNAAKLREAVKAVVDVGYPHNFQKEAPHIRGYCYDITKAIEKCFAALAAPPRNCDAGTPDEQSARFDAHCRKHMGCLTCPLREADGSVPKHCEFRWAQMPYEEGGAK